ncbi:MAG: hypothetical protein Q9212_000681 [Teloschistes hypoglaucus]
MVRLSLRDSNDSPVPVPVPELPVKATAPTDQSSQSQLNAPRSTDWARELPIPRPGELHDFVCVGVGPAALGIGTALQDACEKSTTPVQYRPKVAFIERETDFHWHAGMQLPGVKMQISFIKDVATQRDPRSHFTFLNYLFTKGRLNKYSNLNTFRPSRIEYQDYLKWCADSFRHIIHYGQEVVEVTPSQQSSKSESVDSFLVTCRDVKTGDAICYHTRNVIVAAGGCPSVPPALAKGYAAQGNVLHSSQFQTSISRVLPDPTSKYRIAIVGAGQSGAEIFTSVQTAFPNAQASLIIRGSALRPLDGSPFVNEIFDPEQVTNMYRREKSVREASQNADKATDRGVVNMDLIERIYENMYNQTLLSPPGAPPQHRILRYRNVVGLESSPSGAAVLICENSTALYEECDEPHNERLEFDAVVLATGYAYNSHLKMFKPLEHLLPQTNSNERKKPVEWNVAEDYRVIFDPDKVDKSQAGVWLQGCNEKTHGLGDSLLSNLATRGGEMVASTLGEL